MLNMNFVIIIEDFDDLRQKEEQIDKDKTEICFIYGVDKRYVIKIREKLEVDTDKVQNILSFFDYMLELVCYIKETNAINS